MASAEESRGAVSVLGCGKGKIKPCPISKARRLTGILASPSFVLGSNQQTSIPVLQPHQHLNKSYVRTPLTEVSLQMDRIRGPCHVQQTRFGHDSSGRPQQSPTDVILCLTCSLKKTPSRDSTIDHGPHVTALPDESCTLSDVPLVRTIRLGDSNYERSPATSKLERSKASRSQAPWGVIYPDEHHIFYRSSQQSRKRRPPEGRSWASPSPASDSGEGYTLLSASLETPSPLVHDEVGNPSTKSTSTRKPCLRFAHPPTTRQTRSKTSMYLCSR